MASEKKKKTKADNASAQPVKGGKTAHEKFEMLELHRSQLKGAPYNPRTLSDKARDHLKANIKKVGIIQPPIWNKRSGNIVGGHQRLAMLDAIEGTNDYRLTVAVVDFDSKTEKEQNIFLNNVNAMGDWDLEKLKDLFKEGEVDALLAGFDMAEIYQLFGEDVMANNANLAADLAGSYGEFNQTFEKLAAKANERDGEAFYCLLVFRSNAERESFCKLIGQEDNRYVDGNRLADRLRSALPPEPPATPEQAAQAGSPIPQ